MALPVMMKDKLIVGEHQVDGTRLLIYIYICDRIREKGPYRANNDFVV